MLTHILRTTLQKTCTALWITPHSVRQREGLGEAAKRVLALVEHRGDTFPPLTVRDLHSLADISQSEALRAVSELTARGIVEIEDAMHDPLGAEVRLSAA